MIAIEHTSEDAKAAVSSERCDELVTTHEKLSTAANEKLEHWSDEMDTFPEVNTADIDNIPDCFTFHRYCRLAIEILQGICPLMDEREITQDEADEMEASFSEAKGWLDQAGVQTAKVLNPPVRRRTPKPLQVRQIEKANKAYLAVRAAESNALPRTSTGQQEQRSAYEGVAV